MEELKLIQIQRQVLLTDIMVRANHATLEQRPERFDVVGMHFAAHVLVLAVAHYFMWKAWLEQAIAAVLVRSDQRNLICDGLADESVERWRIGALNDFTDHIALAGDRADHCGLVAHLSAPNVSFLIPMAVLILAADEGLVHFHDSHQLLEIVIPHTSAEPMADVPSGVQRRTLAKEHPSNLTRRNALQALQHRVENFEPSNERHVCVLENRADEHGESIGRVVLIGLVAAEPIEGPRLGSVDLSVPALWAFHLSVRPATIRQISTARRFIGKGRHELLEGHHAE